jgi:hypothetical protein
MSGDHIDLNAAIRQNEVSIVPPEHPDDRALRLKMSDRASWIDDIQRLTTFFVLLIGLAVLASAAAYEAILNNNAAPDTKHWCETVLSAVVSGGISFVLGRNSRNGTAAGK